MTECLTICLSRSDLLFVVTNIRIFIRDWASVGGIAKCYGLEDPDFEPQLDKIFRTHGDRSRGPLFLLYTGYRISFLGLKRQGCGAGHPPLLAITLLLYVPAWRLTGQQLPFISYVDFRIRVALSLQARRTPLGCLCFLFGGLLLRKFR